MPSGLMRSGVDRDNIHVDSASGVNASRERLDLVLKLAPPPDKRLAKAAFGYESKFVVLSDARNQPRKLIPRTLDVMAEFAGEHPDAILHLHTDPHDASSRTESYCYDVMADIEHLGLRDRVRFTAGFRMGTEGGLPIEKVAELYAAADAHRPSRRKTPPSSNRKTHATSRGLRCRPRPPSSSPTPHSPACPENSSNSSCSTSNRANGS